MSHPTVLRFEHILIPPGESLPCVSDPLPSGTAFHAARLNVVCMNLTQTGHELPSCVEIERVFVGEEEQSVSGPGEDFAADRQGDDVVDPEIEPVTTHQTVTIWAKNTSPRMIRFLPSLHGSRE